MKTQSLLGQVLLVAISTTSAWTSQCTTDEDCQLNGLCQASVCNCFAPWSGPSCGILDQLPQPRAAAYGLDCGTSNYSAPHTASWGGNVVKGYGSYHLFVSELTQDCPLLNWMTNTDIVHAVSSSPSGPFERRDTSVAPLSTNPQVIVDQQGGWWLFHIGSGDNTTNQTHCQHPPHLTEAGPVVHQGLGPNGPWTAHSTVNCNNPSPALVRSGQNKGESRLMCSAYMYPTLAAWSVQRSSAGFGGPWEPPLLVQMDDPRPGARWEE